MISVPAMADTHIFSGLEVDLEECVFELADAEPVVPLERELEDVSNAEVSTQSRATLSAREKQRKKKAKKSAKAKLKRQDDFGIDVESVVLIKRHGRMIMTLREFIVSGTFTPAMFVLCLIRFAGSARPVTVVIDTAVIKMPTIPREFVNAIFAHLGGRPVAGATNPITLVSGLTRFFSGRDSRANRFALDTEGFGGRKLSFVLLNAIFRHFKGLCPANSDSIDAEASTANNEVTLSKHAVRVRLIHKNATVSPYGEASIESVKDLVRPQVSPVEIKSMCGRNVPSIGIQQIHAVESQAHQLIKIEYGSLLVILRIHDIFNVTQPRWVFNEIVLVDSLDPLSQGTRTFIDARILFEPPTTETIHLLLRITDSGRSRKLRRQVLARNAPLLKRLYMLATFFASPVQSARNVHHYVVAGFERMARVSRPDIRTSHTILNVLRDDRDEPSHSKYGPGCLGGIF